MRGRGGNDTATVFPPLSFSLRFGVDLVPCINPGTVYGVASHVRERFMRGILILGAVVQSPAKPNFLSPPPSLSFSLTLAILRRN